MLGNRQLSALTWNLATVTHGGPNLLFWDGHVERYVYPSASTYAALFSAKWLSANGSGVTEPYP